MIRTFPLAVSAVLFFVMTSARSAEEEHHPHHVGVDGGLSFQGSKQSGFVGVDYAYRFESNFALGVYFEEVRGDFDLRAFGFAFGRFFENGWKAFTGPGRETKLKNDKNLWLWHVSGGYDWHRGNWSFGPIAAVDFIEDESAAYYLGFSVGYGFSARIQRSGPRVDVQ